MYIVLSFRHRLAAARSRAAYRLLGNAVPDALLSVPASHLCLYGEDRRQPPRVLARDRAAAEDRKSTRLNSSHVAISYAVFCLKKKNMYTGLPIMQSTT